MSHTIAVFALTTRGLEAVSAAEVAALPGVCVTEIGYRRVAATLQASPALLLSLRTVDDLFLDLGSWPGIGRPREALSRLQTIGTRLVLDAAIAIRASLRPLRTSPTFAVTASFVGRRNYTTDEIKCALVAGIVRQAPWRYAARDAAADLSLRVFIEGECAHIGLRLGPRPLHERAYRRVVRAGALKPPVAAALLALAGARSGYHVLDPCCGSGTIVAEAALNGARALGGDADPAAVAAARTNAAVAGVTTSLCRLDARMLPFAGASLDCIVTNLPWGRQVSAGEPLASFYPRLLREIRRVIAPGGRAVLLTTAPELIPSAGWRCREQIEISLAGQRPTVVILSS